MNASRRLEVTEVAFAETEQLPFIAAHPFPQDSERDHILADITIGNTYRSGFQNCRMRFQNFVDLLGSDVHAALDDQFLRAADDEKVTVLVAIREVAGM